MTPEAARQLEADTRRPCRDGVLHPDLCVSITICGVPWYVRPLFPPEGIRFTPQIGEDDVCFDVDAGGADQEIQAVAESIAADLSSYLDGSTLVLEAVGPGGYLSRVCKYLLLLLDQQYDLTPDQKTSLLSFQGTRAPEWLEQTIRHTQSMPPEPPDEGDEE